MRQPTTLGTTVLPAVVTAVLVALLAGCAGGSDPEEADQDAVATCDLLSSEDVEAVAGKDLGEPEPGETTGLPTCRWGSPDDIGVQVIDVPVADWVANLEPALDAVEQDGLADDPATAAKLAEARELLASGDVDDAEGCELFSVFLEIQGLEPGQSRTVNIVPSRESPEAVTAQACAGGRFSSVLIQGSAVTGSDEQVQQVDAALDAVLAHSG